MKRILSLAIVAGLVGSLAPVSSRSGVAEAAPKSGITITLKNDFIHQFAERVTIETQYFIDKAHKKPNPPESDADMHIAGRSDSIGLATVAELMNAASKPDALKFIHDNEGKGSAVTMNGVWRIWCEHAGTDEQVQGAALSPFDTTNPHHVFEIHPLTQVGAFDVRDTLHPIDPGFKTKDAEDAFGRYENLPCTMTLNDTTTTLQTGMAGYNYVEFVMQILGTPWAVEDGTMVMAKVRTDEGELLVHKRRMVMVKGSAPETEIKKLATGKTAHVLGLPRVNLALVEWRMQHAAERPEVLTWNLPYEIVVVGYYGPGPEVDE